MTNIDFEIERPLLFLLMIPLFAVTLIPFFRLHKGRKLFAKRIIPIIIHIIAFAMLTTLVTGIKITETTEAPSDTEIIVVADMSASNSAMKDSMNEYIKALYKDKGENTDISVVAFAGGTVKTTKFDDNEKDDYLTFNESDIDTTVTDIQSALEFVTNEFSTERVNKRVVLLSDGRQTYGNAWSAAKKLTMAKVRLDCAYFNVTEADGLSEVQILAVDTQVDKELETTSNNVTITVSMASTLTVHGTIKIIDANGEVLTDKEVTAAKGRGNYSLKFSSNEAYGEEEAGIHMVKVEFEPERDSISQNNALYTWFIIDDIPDVLIVTDSVAQSTTGRQYVEAAGHEVTVVSTSDFPTNMEGLLPYDEIILMDVDFAKMPENATSLIKRYVEEVGRGLVLTSGENTVFYNDQYNLHGEGHIDDIMKELLPVKIVIEEQKQTVGMVFVVDLSSSMKEHMSGGGPDEYRYDVVKSAVIKCLDSLEKNAYAGVVAFDQASGIVVEMTSIEQKEYLVQQIEKGFDQYFFLCDAQGNPTTGGTSGGTYAPNGCAIKTYGTNYKAGIDAGASLISDFDVDLKQMVFLSDGEPSVHDSGYNETIQNLAERGINTSVIGIDIGGNTAAIDELSRIATNGRTELVRVDNAAALNSTLVNIAESIKGQDVNDSNSREDPIIIRAKDSSKFGTMIGVVSNMLPRLDGYYGTTNKEDARLVLYTDDSRPVVSEWEYGLGKVTVFMSDLTTRWTQALRADPMGEKLVSNVLTSCFNDTTPSSGLTLESERKDGSLSVVVTSYVRVREKDEGTGYQGEKLVATVTDLNGNPVEISDFVSVGNRKYRASIKAENIFDSYNIVVNLVSNDGTDTLWDTSEFAITGMYDEEYNVFESGEDDMKDIAAAGEGSVMEDSDAFYDVEANEMAVYNHDILTPCAIILLVLFVLDVLARNIKPRQIKEKEMMSDEEQAASMRGTGR